MSDGHDLIQVGAGVIFDLLRNNAAIGRDSISSIFLGRDIAAGKQFRVRQFE